MNNKKLYRIPSESVIGGVSAGLADYFGIDKVIVRILWVLLFFYTVHVPAVMLYIICWIAFPKGERSNDSTASNAMNVAS